MCRNQNAFTNQCPSWVSNESFDKLIIMNDIHSNFGSNMNDGDQFKN